MREMKVKAMKLALALSVSMAASAAMAQATATTPNQAGIDSDITLLRSDVQTQRTAVVTSAMKLTDDQGKAFWPLYREYTNRQQALGDDRVAIIKDYANSYDTMDDSKADDLAKRQLKYTQDRVKLQSEYYGKFKKAVGAKQAAKFVQIDNRLNMIIDLQLASTIPVLQ
jgi:Spy/CpxP family protein refolding chaperone